ncbi:MAG: bifunctional oligoribonuclease/PAP phosphatase NrnA [Bacteroidota bacterium]
MPLQFETLRTIIDSHKRFILTSHVNPDGDGLGSEVALAHYLELRGKQVSILNCSATPENYLFLHQLHPILQFDPSRHENIVENAEVIILLDANDPDRLDAMTPSIMKSHAVKVCIDHHPEPGEFADLYLLDEQSSATGEILYYFISMAGGTIDRVTATALYTAIMTDTGSFRYQKTDSEVHTIVAHLLQAGADPVAIYEQVYERTSAKRLRLLGMALANMQMMYNGKVAYITLTREMFEATGTTEEDTDAFVPYTLTIDGVQIGLMFSEMDNIVKVNFRSKGDIAINELAKEFGGNGHKNAAGARVPNVKLDEIVSLVLKRAGKYV